MDDVHVIILTLCTCSGAIYHPYHKEDGSFLGILASTFGYSTGSGNTYFKVNFGILYTTNILLNSQSCINYYLEACGFTQLLVH